MKDAIIFWIGQAVAGIIVFALLAATVITALLLAKGYEKYDRWRRAKRAVHKRGDV